MSGTQELELYEVPNDAVPDASASETTLPPEIPASPKPKVQFGGKDQARAELESQLRAERFTAVEGEYHQKVSPRPAISHPPRKLISLKLQELDRSRAA